MPKTLDATQVKFLGEFISQGRRWNAYSDGTVLPVIAGGDGTDDAAAAAAKAAADKAAADAKAAGDAKTFTQAELDAIIARKENEAKSSAAQKVADDLGVPLDEAKELIKKAKDDESAKMTEAEKREKAAIESEQKAKDREAAADAREREASVRAALAEAGCSKDDIADAKRLVDLPDGDLDDKKVETAVEELKKRRPELFGGKKADDPAGFTPPGAPTMPKTSTRMSDVRAKIREQRKESASA